MKVTIIILSLFLTACANQTPPVEIQSSQVDSLDIDWGAPESSCLN
jgi:hypothetical protein